MVVWWQESVNTPMHLLVIFSFFRPFCHAMSTSYTVRQHPLLKQLTLALPQWPHIATACNSHLRECQPVCHVGSPLEESQDSSCDVQHSHWHRGHLGVLPSQAFAQGNDLQCRKQGTERRGGEVVVAGGLMQLKGPHGCKPGSKNAARRIHPLGRAVGSAVYCRVGNHW